MTTTMATTTTTTQRRRMTTRTTTAIALATLLTGLLTSASATAETVAVAAPAPTAPAPATPRKMIIGTYVNQIYGIDIKNSQFTVDLYVWFRWEGDDWKPLDTFEIVGGRITSKGNIIKKKIGAETYLCARIVATITKFWDMKRYPLDDHQLVIEIEDTFEDDRTMFYEVDRDNTGTSPELQVAGWVIKRTAPSVAKHTYHTNYGDTTLATNQASSYSRYTFAIDVARPGYGRFLKVFFGLFVALLISWCAFLVRPKESSPRVSLGVGATFAAAAVTIAINNSLPDTNLVTMADKLIMLTLGLIVASVGVTIAALMLFAREKIAPQQRMDRICVVLFPSFYLLMLIWIVRG